MSPQDFPKRVRGVDGGDAWHVYRHTFAVLHYKAVLDGTMEKEDLHQMLRHKQPSTTYTYLNAFNVELKGTSKGVEESWRIQEQLQEQAIREHSGRGLSRKDSSE
ncbi:hypothetical protein DB31_1580 [Hyalangium minutum]|uniref:Uncharacterized protein n=1 Tax=Hyalangium minutum TaxID=394096 RepID=A0A085WCQ1_9BACT|nr:hypothetical protein DB31_1580 [Hyalangium minutum]